MDYTPAQLRAIHTIDRNLQIIACAGSGKTQVISRRVVEILQQGAGGGIRPANIVAFTFTDRAAAELKDRIQRLCLQHLGSDIGLAEMFVGTIHAYCLNLLQQAPVYKFLKYSVLTDIQQRLLIDRNSAKSGLNSVPLLAGGTLRRYLDSALYQQILGILGEGDVDARQVPIGVLAAADKYWLLCDEHKHLDYSNMLRLAVGELRANAQLRGSLAGVVKYLVVDEYQDVNPLQERLIKEIHGLGANICVVGDDDQTIYQWRGSEVQNIIHFFDRYPSVATERLNENFRSSKGIVLSARQVIERNPDRLRKAMESTNAQPYVRGDVLALVFPGVQEEAAWIAEKIQFLHDTAYLDRPGAVRRGLAWSDMAVLLRSVRRDGEPIINALKAAEIPYLVGGMTGLFDTPEIKSMRQVFYFLADYTPRGEPLPTLAALQHSFGAVWWGISSKGLSAGLNLLRERKRMIGSVMNADLYLQKLYLDFLDWLGLREENIRAESGRTGGIVFYNLGKFSQVISDFETINFHTTPARMYETFAGFLEFQASDYYPEGWEESGHTKPDAVQVMTVHQAKGMQWPAVFVPCLRRNRFPSRRQGGRSVWHVIPELAVPNADRYKGRVDDERRLFYVALTRAEKYLFCSWAPIPSNQQQRHVSEFFREFSESEWVLTREPALPKPERLEPKPRVEEAPLPLTFSELKYYFECPYLFKLRFLYGFDAPISRALGYGKSLHDALAEIHAESLRGRIPALSDVPRLVDDHLHLPFASADIRENLRASARKALHRYLEKHQQDLQKLEHVEKQIELKLEDGIMVTGRVDLIRRTDTDETVIVDFKSDERAQAEDITRQQLHVYAVGYQRLTGRNADRIEIHNLDRGGVTREVVDEGLIASTLAAIVGAGRNLRADHLPKLPEGSEKCGKCEMSCLCREPANCA
jgi:DNA helicase-2/ATP-dependent DNA helicase PcrA